MFPATGLCGDEAARRGYQWLLERPYVPPYFDEQTFDAVWQVWPEPLRSQAASATAGQRRQLAFNRYGLAPRPGDDSGKPLQFVVTQAGKWVPNCFTCHGGNVLGETVPGAPNSRYALETLIEETRQAKLRLGKPLDRIDLGALFMPLGGTSGTTNAVMFGVVLAAYRDKDLNVRPRAVPPQMLHHDMDAPPWWHFHKKQRIYLDGFALKGHRPLMQFALDRANGPEKFREWEGEFRDIFAYMETVKPPPYPFAIDQELAAKGRTAFERVCSECHGTYGESGAYPQRVVAMEELGTDRARFDALTRRHRLDYQQNWFSHYGQDEVILDPAGYVAPPLDGVWASSPYFHNGSVPTVWHVLHPDERPVVWIAGDNGYDQRRLGSRIEELSEVPLSDDPAARRRCFDTRAFGKSAAGHHYPDVLSDDEKTAVLEYLKTL